MQNGLENKPANESVSLAVARSYLREPEPCFVLASVAVVSITESVGIEPVFNLTVEDSHEFFANGVLVHNCTWLPDDVLSPDRMDAMVWVFTELMLGQQAWILV